MSGQGPYHSAFLVRPIGLRLYILTAAAGMGMLLAALDFSIVGTAMPTVIGSLGGFELYTWVFSGYALVSTTCMPIFGRLSDVYGRKRLYLAGLLIFVIASGLCGFAQSMIQLILFRALQGVGGAAIFALTITIISEMYPIEKRGQIQGVTTSMWAIASIAGPTLGGYLTESVGWRWVFLVNLPVSVIPIVTLGLLMTEIKRPRQKIVFDFAGTALLSAMIVSVLLSAQWGGKEFAWASWQTAGLLGGAVVLFVLFLRVEKRALVPMIPLELFSIRMFALGSIASLIFGCASNGLTTFVPLFVQGVLGGSPSTAGAGILPLTLGWSISAGVSGTLVRPLGYRTMNLVGFGLILIGYSAMLFATASIPLVFILIPMGIVGVGCGACSSSLLLAMQNVVGQELLGAATGLAMFFRNTGFAIGISVLGAIQVARMEQRFGGPVPDISSMLTGGTVEPALRDALAGSLHDAWILAIIVTAMGFVLASRMTGWRVAPAGSVLRPVVAVE